MKVELRVFATYRKPVAEKLGQKTEDSIYVDLSEGSSLGQLIDLIGLGEEAVIISLVNGIHQDKNYLLSDGDRIGLFPPVGGG